MDCPYAGFIHFGKVRKLTMIGWEMSKVGVPK
jgi:hypothetical protein